MRILLTGSSGLIGHYVAEAAIRRGHNVVALYHSNKPDIPGLGSRQQANLTDANTITQIALEIFPDAIVNAAAISSPVTAREQPDIAEKLNVQLPGQLASIASHLSAKIIHLSSDLVFDGTKGNYCSTDQPNPLSLYGGQKLEAEKAVLEHAGNFATVLRLTLQLGNSLLENRSPHERMFDAWSKGNKPVLFTDEFRQTSSSENVAEVIIELCERNDLHGIFHWAGSETLSRYELGARILKHFGLPEDLITPAKAVDQTGLEERPLNLSFNLHPLAGKLKTPTQTIKQQLENLVVPVAYRKWYHSL